MSAKFAPVECPEPRLLRAFRDGIARAFEKGVELEQEERHSFSVEPTDAVVRLRGRLRMPDAPAIWTEVREATSKAKKGALTIDLSGAEAIDGGVMSLLVALRT